MKQIFLFSVLMLFSIAIFAQAAPVSELRVGTTAATFKDAVPIGTKVYVVTGGTYWVATAAIASGTVVSDAATAGSLVILNQAEQNITRDAVSGNASVINISKTKADGTVDTPSSITVKADGINTISTAVAGQILVTATDDQVLGYAQNAADNKVSITGSTVAEQSINILPATATVAAGGTNLAGLMTPAQVTKLQNISDGVVGTYATYSWRVSAAEATTPEFTIPSLKAQNATYPVTTSNILITYNGVPIMYHEGAGPTYSYDIDLVAGATYGKITFHASILPLYENDLITVTYIK